MNDDELVRIYFDARDSAVVGGYDVKAGLRAVAEAVIKEERRALREKLEVLNRLLSPASAVLLREVLEKL